MTKGFTMKGLKLKRARTRLPSDKESRKIKSTKSSEVTSVSSNESSDDSKVPFTSSNDSSSWEIKKSICRYLIENEHDFSVATSPSFKKMINLFMGKVDCEIPTVQELKGFILKDVVKEVDDYVNAIKSSWADTGCSVLLDEWTNPKGRNVMNVLLDCPKGTVYFNSYDVSDIIGDTDALQHFFDVVLMEIGIGNVVQVVTNSASSLTNEFRMQLSDKFRSVFWTQSATCCIGLMLEKISAIDHIKETLDKAKFITRFIHGRPSVLECLSDRTDGHNLVKRYRIKSSLPFRRLENILLKKDIFTDIFLSPDSTHSIDGKKAADVMVDKSFWSGASAAVRAAMPLVSVIDWLDENVKAQIGYIYETIDQAKETIKEEFFNKKSDYMPYWDIIDNVWDEQLHSPLHSAGYFLNPNIIYTSDFVVDSEVVNGLLRCVIRSTDDVRVQDKISLQLEQYQNAKGCFSEGRNSDPSLVPPVEWWSNYGKDCPELQRLAIRILSQTCDGASRFQLERNLAETVAEDKGRNPSEQKRLSKVTRLRYNMMLQNYASGESSNPMSEDIELFVDEDIFLP